MFFHRIFVPILFIILNVDFFDIKDNLGYATYADETTTYVCWFNFIEIIDFLDLKSTKYLPGLSKRNL